jgi:glycosyltransferase involved in cell wall biosynthesis
MESKISLFIPSLSGGGAERAIIHLAQGFAQQGFQVDLVVAQQKGSYHLPNHYLLSMTDLRKRRIIACLPGLIGYLRRNQPEVIISAMDHANLVALWARRFAGVPSRIITTTHTMISLAPLANVPRRECLIPFLAHIFYPWADHIVAVSQAAAEDLTRKARLPHASVKVIYNPIVTPELLQMAHENLDHPWFMSGSPPVILAVGRLAIEKNFSILIKAFKEVRERMNVRLMILGEGEDRELLEDLIKEYKLSDSVSLPGFVSNPFVFMANAGVLVLSSNWEGLPSVLIEAMACGTPVVSTDCPGGAAEILDGGRFGRLVPMGDAYALAEAIVDVLASQSNAEMLRRRAMDFSVEIITQQYIDMIYG